MTLPTSGFYSHAMSSYFGYMDPTEQQKLWDLFLQNYALNTNPSDTDPTAQAEFIHFAQGTVNRMMEMQSQVTLPPSEIEKRKILFETFDSILLMLNVVQQTIGVQSKQIIFLGNWQNEYTAMMTRVPIYVPSPTEGWKPSSDADSFTLGFNDISIKEVSEYVISSGEKISLTNGDVTFEFIPDDNQGNVEVIYTNRATSSTDVITETPTSDTFDSRVSALNQAFLNTYNAHLSDINTSVTNYGSPSLPWRFVAITVPANDDTARKENNTITQNRGEANTRNQVIIENIRSRRQTIRDFSGTIQSNLQASRDKMTQISDLLTSLLESFKSITLDIAK